jgi:hypothetical protein
MNYYDELGVPQSASIEEIQHAYKALVRILHPDQQQEDNLRRLSDLQLRRLNQIVSVLTNPEKRRNYDLGLNRLLPAVAPRQASWSDLRAIQPQLHFKPGMLVWPLIALILIASAFFWFREPEPAHLQPHRPESREAEGQAKSIPQNATAVPLPVPSSTLPAPAQDQEHGTVREPERNPHRTASRNHPKPEEHVSSPVRVSATSKADAIPSSPQLQIKPEYAQSAAPVSPPVETQKVRDGAAPPAEIKKPSTALTGRWLYAPRDDDNDKSLYPPQYIELQIHDRAGGMVRGKYYAKYKISDRAISPEMSFQFEGKLSDRVSVLPWSSKEGSQGEIRLKRISGESIEVTWITTKFGRSDMLASGTATLYRSDP